MKKPDHHVDIVLELLRLSLGASDVSERRNISWNTVDWSRVVGFASAHLVLPALASPVRRLARTWDIPRDFVAFLEAVEHANICRNNMLRRACVDIGAALDKAGVKPVVLKGGAILCDEHSDAADWRFMGDIDFLVPETELMRCVERVLDLGYVQYSASQYCAKREAHYPPLVSPCGGYSIELHSRLFSLGDYGLPAEVIFGQAGLAADPAINVLLPSRIHRVVHLLSHAQLHNRHWLERRVVLKDLMDLSVLTELDEDFDWECVRRCYSEAGGEFEAAWALVAAWAKLMLPGSLLSNQVGPRIMDWVGKAERRLYRSSRLSAIDALSDALRIEVYRLSSERGHLASSLATDHAAPRIGNSGWGVQV